MRSQTLRAAAAGTLLIGLLAAGLSGCAQAESSESSGSALEIAAGVAAGQTELPQLAAMGPEDENFSAYLYNVYGIDARLLADGAVCYSSGVEAAELAVLVFDEEEDAQQAQTLLEDYIALRAAALDGYAPDEAALAADGAAVSRGRYAALLIAPDMDAAEADFAESFEDGWTPPAFAFGPEAEAPAPADEEVQAPALDPALDEEQADAEDPASSAPEQDSEQENGAPSAEAAPQQPADTADDAQGSPVPPAADERQPEAVTDETQDAPANTDETAASGAPSQNSASADIYDGAAVLAAWRSRDPSALSGKSRAVYDAASAIIARIITDGMSDYEKELAVHDHIVESYGYDEAELSNVPNAVPDPDNDNPYGMLIHGVGICRGYASTFQLFMDMLGIECITVEGSYNGGEHAWNMVRLNGDWYGVDTTWDDPINDEPNHLFFNVTSTFLRMTGHEWDADGVPEATTFMVYLPAEAD